MTGSPPATQQRKTPAVVELLVALLIGVGGVVGFVPVSSTPFLLALAWISLRVRRTTWRRIGFCWPANWGRAIAVGVVAGALYQLVSLYVAEPALARVTGARPDASLFASLTGNVPMLVGIVASLAFGLSHAYQGTSGIVDNVLACLVFAAAYSVTGENLVAPIIAHGTYDTIGAVLMFLRKYPGQ